MNKNISKTLNVFYKTWIEERKKTEGSKKDIKPYGKTPKIPLQKIKRIEYKTPTTKRKKNYKIQNQDRPNNNDIAEVISHLQLIRRELIRGVGREGRQGVPSAVPQLVRQNPQLTDHFHHLLTQLEWRDRLVMSVCVYVCMYTCVAES